MGRPSSATVLVLLGIWLTPGNVAQGQSLAEFFSDSYQFNLSTPGARSLAMGGTFLALADDATAAYTNPAGLTNLSVGGSEVAVELRKWRFTGKTPDGGHREGEPTGIGVDTKSGVEVLETTSDVTGLSFLSFGYVMPHGLTLAFYRHEVANFLGEVQTEGLFLGNFDCSPLDPWCELECLSDFRCGRGFAQRIKSRLEIVDYGVSGAFEIKIPSNKGKESTLSVGFGISYYQLDLRSQLEEFITWEEKLVDELGFDEEGNPLFLGSSPEYLRLPGHLFGPADFLDDLLYSTVEELGDDDAFAINVGWLWKFGPAQRWSLGGVYRQGPDFTTRFRFEREEEEDPLRGTHHVPDVFGVGVAFSNAGGKTKVALDVNRVRYSQRLTDVFPDAGPDFSIEDVDEFHVGFEHVFLVVESLFVGTARLGFWNDPAHEALFQGEPEPGAKDFNHVSAGFGLVIKEDYQIDVAADFSERADTVSVSLVKFF